MGSVLITFVICSMGLGILMTYNVLQKFFKTTEHDKSIKST